MTDIEGEGAHYQENIKSTHRENKKGSKIENDLQSDLIKYNELLLRDQNLELDIPPKRTKTRSCQNFSANKDDHGSKILRGRKRRISLKSMQNKSTIAHKSNGTYIAEQYQQLRPKHYHKNQIYTSGNILKFTNNKMAPPSLSNIDRFKSFENKILLENTYQDLIKLVKKEMNCNLSIDEQQQDSIDILLHWNLFSKNIDLEKRRFDITDPYYLDFQPQSLTSTNSLFCSEDIDLFFQKLNDNSNFEQFNTVEQFIPESSIKEYLKRTIPLA